MYTTHLGNSLMGDIMSEKINSKQKIKQIAPTVVMMLLLTIIAILNIVIVVKAVDEKNNLNDIMTQMTWFNCEHSNDYKKGVSKVEPEYCEVCEGAAQDIREQKEQIDSLSVPEKYVRVKYACEKYSDKTVILSVSEGPTVSYCQTHGSIMVMKSTLTETYAELKKERTEMYVAIAISAVIALILICTVVVFGVDVLRKNAKVGKQ